MYHNPKLCSNWSLAYIPNILIINYAWFKISTNTCERRWKAWIALGAKLRSGCSLARVNRSLRCTSYKCCIKADVGKKRTLGISEGRIPAIVRKVCIAAAGCMSTCQATHEIKECESYFVEITLKTNCACSKVYLASAGTVAGITSWGCRTGWALAPPRPSPPEESRDITVQPSSKCRILTLVGWFRCWSLSGFGLCE